MFYVTSRKSLKYAMKVTLNWLKNHVDFDWSPEELTERLTLLGLEVEGVKRLAGAFEGIVVAQVLSRDKHPNADKLSVCRVADGRGERQIVCGAQNFQAGDKVPLILPGASLPPKAGDQEPFVIKVGKIRGVESHGMMCSPAELGLPDAVDGLLILPPTAPVGQPFAEFLGRAGSDVVYDLEVTPNRPDLNSVIGIAREIAALTGNPLRLPKLTADPIADAPGVAVRIDAPDLCPRYTARVIRGVRVGPSPDWLRSMLEKVGLRSINNVVDVSNFVMLETGQPLHTFDLRLIEPAAVEGGLPTLVIRRAGDGELFTTLDGREHRLTPENLLIADSAKGIALAGVMGGLNTEIRETTTDVLIESAYFTPTQIRRTSKALGLRTDASYRFERGADPEAAGDAGRRCADLILATAGGVADGMAVDVRPAVPETKSVVLRHERVEALLGVAVPDADQIGMLTRLGLTIDTTTAGAPGSSRFTIPSWRVDLKREADLIEEIARLYGVDRIPSTPPRRAVGSHPFDEVYDQLAAIRRQLAALGLNEAQGQTLINDDAARLTGLEPVLLSNPLSSDMNALRPSLLPGLIDCLSHNLTRRNGEVQLFEIGRVFNGSGEAVGEGWRLAVAHTGMRNPLFWSGADRDATCDLSDLKGLVEDILEGSGLRGVTFTRRPEAGGLWIESAVVALGGKRVLGQLGQMQPGLAKRRDLRDPVLLAELDLDLLLARRSTVKTFKPLPQFPSIRRDVAMMVPETVTHEAVLEVVRHLKPANLESMDPFDVFRGRQVPAGQKSLAYALTYRAADRTLREEDVTPVHTRLVEGFRNTIGASIRE